LILTKYKKKIKFLHCLKWLGYKIKKYYSYLFHLKNNEKLILENYREFLKYVFQSQYKFKKLKNLVFHRKLQFSFFLLQFFY
jgi:hypothetical protein